MNPRLSRLQPYPFERLRLLLAGTVPPPISPIRLSIGEPQHKTPDVIRHALIEHLDGLGIYPSTAGLDSLREVLAAWFKRRYAIPRLDSADVIPLNGTREGLFAFAQAVVDSARMGPVVVCPNPFYQVYEGAALLSGARPLFLNQTSDDNFRLKFDSLTADEWGRTQLMYVCSPGNPTGRVLALEEWQTLFELSEKYGFVIASDECYSEIYGDESTPPLGALEAAHKLGRDDFHNLVVFTSLSKRSSAPGLRSGCAAGDAALLGRFLLYRTYHGCAMSLAVQHASIAAWCDESHVRDNRVRYREKFAAVVPLLTGTLDVVEPEAGFYLWTRVPGGDDIIFARELFARTNVTVLPGQFLARDAHGVNPGRGYVRLALVATLEECVEAAGRIAAFCRS